MEEPFGRKVEEDWDSSVFGAACLRSALPDAVPARPDGEARLSEYLRGFRGILPVVAAREKARGNKRTREQENKKETSAITTSPTMVTITSTLPHYSSTAAVGGGSADRRRARLYIHYD
jgi:hypothetical protein